MFAIPYWKRSARRTPGASLEGGEALDDRFNLRIHYNRLIEFGATVNNPVTYGVDFGCPLQDCRLIFLQTFQQVLDSFL